VMKRLSLVANSLQVEYIYCDFSIVIALL
jgi:hypothetical protein